MYYILSLDGNSDSCTAQKEYFDSAVVSANHILYATEDCYISSGYVLLRMVGLSGRRVAQNIMVWFLVSLRVYWKGNHWITKQSLSPIRKFV